MNDTRPIRWAIVGTGAIADTFARDLAHARNASLAAVCSRRTETAQAFAARFGCDRTATNIDAIGNDPGIDAVYLATPNTAHIADALKLVACRKPVLVEKPVAATYGDAVAIARAAQDQETLVMEGLWTRFLPAMRHARTLIADGAIGVVTKITADLAYRKDFDPNSRFYRPDLGGGSLLDLGVYSISATLFLLGHPSAISGAWMAAESGVDRSATIALDYGDAKAVLSCGFDRDGANQMVIEGTRGAIVLEAPFLKASILTLMSDSRSASRYRPFGSGVRPTLIRRTARRLPLPGCERHDFSFPGGGLQFEIDAFGDALRQGKTIVEDAPLADSIETLRIIERVLARPPA